MTAGVRPPGPDDPMQSSTPSRPPTDRDESDTWPWRCLDCDTTIYHDGEFCLTCESSHRISQSSGESDRSNGFRDWMRDQTATRLVLKVTAVAAIELALTTFWLQTLVLRSPGLGSVVPVVS